MNSCDSTEESDLRHIFATGLRPAVSNRPQGSQLEDLRHE